MTDGESLRSLRMTDGESLPSLRITDGESLRSLRMTAASSTVIAPINRSCGTTPASCTNAAGA
jgi:hypothetical protein